MAFPLAGVAGFAWIAPGLLLGAAFGASPRQAFRLGYLAGATHYLIGLYWLLHMPVSFYPILGWLALSLFLALYPACWVWGCGRLWPGSVVIEPEESAMIAIKRAVLQPSWRQRTRWSLLCAASWVTWEIIQSRLFTGFPWNLLGASQQRLSLLTQIADRTGVYGISFLVAWTSVCLLLAALILFSAPQQRWRWQAHALPPFLVVLALCEMGWMRLMTPSTPSGSLRIALIQPSFPQTMVWDDTRSADRFERLIALSTKAMESRPDLMVWPEAALPYPLRYDVRAFDAITNLLAGHSAWLCLASDDIVFSQDSAGAARTNIYNSAFLLNPRGEIKATYAKRRLVLFGEYVPLLDWLPFLRLFTPITGGFTPGDKRVTFELPDRRVRFAPLICFEDAFPQSAREQAQDGVDFLLNLTNDGWFGESAQQWQHAQNAAMRAVENGVPLVRCANNGVTCWIEPHGRMMETGVGPDAASIYSEGYRIIELPLTDEATRHRTSYQRYGDIFGWSCVALVILAALQQRPLRKRPRSSPTQ